MPSSADEAALHHEYRQDAAGEEPKVRRIAMSRRLSFTTMTMVDTMLKAATATINERITNKMRLVIAMERKKFTCSLVQSWISTPPPIAIAAARAHAAARHTCPRASDEFR